jgi:hypothetical protein
MSQFITKLGEDGRDGLEWPTPVGTWKQGESINRLETFANNLDVSQSSTDTDLLNSVPTPWARLLLFESALYKEKHPSHKDIEDQWRGLLGVIALAAPLRLNLKVKSVTLSQQVSQHQSKIAKTFLDLRPHPQTSEVDEEADKWDDFQMILVDDVVLGSTSPRTLLFTGVAHQCPSSIPFRSPQGRLSDPVAYYKKFHDNFYLSLLARWVGGLIAALEHNQPLIDWMGAPPAAPGAAQTGRMEFLLERLRAWRQELSGAQPANVVGNLPSRFTLYPYTVINSLPEVQQTPQSDLFISGRKTKDMIVAYHPEAGSKLLNSFGQELVNEPLRVYNGRWIQANQPLPLPFTFLPSNIKSIEDPLAFFEDTLIQFTPPTNPDAVYHLSFGGRRYLYPFKTEILDYFTPAEVADKTEIFSNDLTNSLRIEFQIPIENNRSVKAVREYPLDTVIADEDTVTPELAAWPDFTCQAWSRYFYFKSTSLAKPETPLIEFEPTVSYTSRSNPDHTWYVTSEPLKAFAGSVNGKTGLLLLRDNRISPPNKFWKVGVDFGSTHTRAFSLQVDRQGDEKSGYTFATTDGAAIQPIQFSPRARELTYCQPGVLQELFLALTDTPNLEGTINELKTLMMIPEPDGGWQDWLPREGFVYTHWIYEGDYNADSLHFNLKWNSRKEDHDLRAFLRSLLVMLQAEAIRQGAQMVSVAHTYPSVFTAALIAKHNGEWSDLESYLNSGVIDPRLQLKVEPAAMTETVAVCRHLEWEQQASPVSNTISIDVGGSTSDMAVWTQLELKLQESVKLAAGILGRYVQSPDAQVFIEWFESIMRAAPHNIKNLSVAKFASKPSGYSLMLTNLLSLTERRSKLQDLIDKVNAAPEARRFMSHIIFLFGGLLYYAGMLARKAKLPQHQDTYNIYFCGKGGTLFQWIVGYDILAQEMFEAGLFGPDGKGDKDSLTVVARISRRPKEEVGRGLLALSELQGNPKGQSIGLIDPNTPSVTVGDTGYGTLNWNDKLTPEAIKQLPVNTVPAMSELKELNTFLGAFNRGSATEAAAKELGLNKVNESRFKNNLLQRLFGTSKGCIVSDVRNNDDDALIEPLFITEIKVLLETTTQNIEMYP